MEECREGPELLKLLREERPENEDRLPEDLEDEDLELEDLELDDLELEDLCDELDERELELCPLGGMEKPPFFAFSITDLTIPRQHLVKIGRAGHD